MEATLSFNMSGTEISIEHNNRTITVPHSDPSRKSENYYWSDNKSLEQTYADLFADDVAAYNAKQKRADRRIGSYLERITEGYEKEKIKLRKLRGQGATRRTIRQNQKAVKPCYEFIVSIGNKWDTPQFCCKDGEQRMLAREILQRYIEDFARRYNGKGFGIEMFNATIHLDETEHNGVIHAHINIVFHSNDNKRGMQHQVSMNRALHQLGFVGDEKTLPITEWEESERKILRELCAEYGITIVQGNGGEHKHKDQYILEKEQEKLKREKEQFEEVLYQNETGNVFLVMRENDELREELSVLQKNNDTQATVLSQLWEEYKRDNSQYWQQYSEHKTQLKKEIALLSSQQKSNQEQLYSLFRSIFSDNGFILTRLFRLVSALLLRFKIERQEQMLNELQDINKQLKAEAKIVCNVSKMTAQALKSKDIERVYATMEEWENALKIANMSIENRLQYARSEHSMSER